MGHLLDASRALLTTLRQVLRAPVTVEFPKQIRKRAERYRASFALLHDEHGEELCIGCLQCERICPSRVISIKQAPKRESIVTGKKRGFAEDFTLDTTACIVCELCVQVCPTDALIMTQVADIPAYSREDLVLTMAKLYAHEKSNPPSWGNGSRLMAMQELPKEAKKPKPAKPAPAVTTVTAATNIPETAATNATTTAAPGTSAGAAVTATAGAPTTAAVAPTSDAPAAAKTKAATPSASAPSASTPSAPAASTPAPSASTPSASPPSAPAKGETK